MASNSGAQLRIRVSADLADIKQGLGLLRGDLRQLKAQVAQSAPDLSSWTNGLKAVRNQVVGLVAAWASLSGVRVLGTLADEATQLRGRIAAAKGDYEAILTLANETRSGLNATVDLYARLERGTRQQNLGQERLLGLTRSVNQAIRLSFTSTAAGEAAVMQFGQALAAGTLRGDELNSVLEQTSRLAEAVAAGMGIQVGQLKTLAKEGKLTATEVIKALESQGAALEKEFAAMPKTLGDAMTVLRNSFLDYIGDVDKSTGASRKLAEAITKVAADLPRYLDPLLKMVTLLITNFDTLAVAVGTYFGIQAVASAVAGIRALIAGMAALRAAIVATEVSAKGLRVALATMGGPITLAIAALTAGIYYLYQRTSEARVAAEEHTKALEANRNMAYQSRDAAIADAKAKREQALRTLQAAQAALEERRARLADTQSRFARGGDRGDGQALAAATAANRAQAQVDQAEKAAEDWARRLVDLAMQVNDEMLQAATTPPTAGSTATGKAIAASNALLRDTISRALREVDRLYEANEIGTRDYFRKRQALQEEAIDAEIAQARAELAVTKELGPRRKLEEDIVRLQRDRAELGGKTAHEQKAAEESLSKQLGEVKIQLLELDGETGRAARARLYAEYQDLFERLKADSDATGEAMVNNLIDRLVARSSLDQLRERIGKATGALQGDESSISAQASAGLIGPLEAERQLHAARQTTLDLLRKAREETLAFLATLDPKGTEAAEARLTLQGLNTDIANIIASQQQMRQDIEGAGVQALQNFFGNIREGSMGAGEVLRQLTSDFSNMVFDILAQATSKKLVSAISGLFGQGKEADVGKGAVELTGAATATGIAGGIILTGAQALSSTAKELMAAATQLMIANGLSSFGAAHGGGVVGRLQMVRHNISPMVFGAAPRYHSGGIAGLAPNEVPAILERGETVRTQQQERALAARLDAGSGGPSRVATPMVVIGDDAVASAMASAAGTDVIVTTVMSNWQRIQQGAG